MKHKTDGFSAALILVQECGEMTEQDDEKRTSTFKLNCCNKTFIFNHTDRTVEIIKEGS